MAMFKKQETERNLNKLPMQEYKLIDIVKIILSCEPLQKEGLFNKTPLCNQDIDWNDSFYSKDLVAKFPLGVSHISGNLAGQRINLLNCKIDINYQRVLRLKKIIEHLTRSKDGTPLNYSSMLAGSIDFAIRPNGEVFIWDGFRRAILALLNGIRYVQGSIEVHPKKMLLIECRKVEAYCFKVKNGDNETMAKEELFKSGVAFDDPDSLHIRDILIESGLDVLGVHPGHPTMGAFSEFQDTILKKKTPEKNLIQASKKTQYAWTNGSGAPSNITGYVLCGLAKYLEVMNEVDENGSPLLSFNHDISENHESCDVAQALHEYAQFAYPSRTKKIRQQDGKGNSQNSLCANRIAGKSIESVAYHIAVHVMKIDKKQRFELSEVLNFDDGEADLMNMFAYDSDTNSTVA